MRFFAVLLLFLPTLLFSQRPTKKTAVQAAPTIEKRALEIADVHRWRKIENQRITSNGQWVAYLLTPTTEGDNLLCLWNASTAQTDTFHRAAEPRFSYDGAYLVFKIKPPLDTLKAQRRRKVKEDDLPKDSLGVYTLATRTLEKLADVRSYALPEKWSGWLACQLEAAKEEKPKKETKETAAPDSTKTSKPAPEEKPKNVKKEDAKDNGSRLLLRELATGRTDTVPFVREYRFAKRGPALVLHSSGRDSAFTAGVYRFDCGQRTLRPLFLAPKSKFAQLALDDWGRQAAFLADTDTTKARVRPWQLHYWSESQLAPRLLADTGSAFLPRRPEPWGISEHARPEFSEDGSKLYFGIAPPIPLPDTTLLPEEIVQVEVWAWTQNRVYTEQAKRLDADKKRSYPVVCHLDKNTFVALGSPDVPDWRFQPQHDANLALGISEEPYAHRRQWEGEVPRDVYAVNVNTGEKRLIVNGLRCSPSLSPSANFVLWWSDPDTAWFAWDARRAQTARLTDNRSVRFFNEESDTPDYPNAYGSAGWLNNDAALLLYDRYDLWKTDPAGGTPPQRLTRGRETRTTYRYIRLDPEEYAIAPDARLLLHHVNDETKAQGYAWLDLKTAVLTPWLSGDYAYTRSPVKAEKSDALLFTRNNYHTFPDLHYTAPNYGGGSQISRANPQQAEYRWGSIERVRWTALSGEKLEGLLVKPDNFDPKKQYPMVVNFYEKLSDDLHVHRSPDVHRSTINYTMYASRGYLVFAPDIPYRTGYPGESAYNAVMSGVTALLDKGFVAPKRIAMQGHSWGGYQAAYIVTRTNLFVCAEAGAPVANMTSAYGGIRWETGLVRQFQYEHQQSRIGGTLWDYPMRYLENSPLFSLDKVQTPLLILHNDKDGAVPWYQGIELFTGLRRLDKPVWMLNYNDEPHWPVKLQNRIDFQTRMQQFFDHYLLGTPMPSWMKRGVSPMEKGIRQGLETGGQ
ncbi:MAG: prolyl oligopeptidase family serine peptidase [Saprospiraceae bacterium]